MVHYEQQFMIRRSGAHHCASLFLLLSVCLNADSWGAEVAHPAFVRNAAGTAEIIDSANSESSTGLELDFSHLKIAILDNGFAGYQVGSSLLPTNTTLVEGIGNPLAPSAHGMAMAQIAWEAMGRPELSPQLFLMNANGFTSFKTAVQTVMDQEIDIVLYSQIWLLGTNGDSSGFINQLVSKALGTIPGNDDEISKRRIWVNAAGNFGGRVFDGKVSEQLDRCLRFKSLYDDLSVQITMVWNDFGNTETEYTKKDLNFILKDALGNQVGSAAKIQRGEVSREESDGLSGYPREELVMDSIQRGEYCIQIEDASSNFNSKDRVRVVIRTERLGAIQLIDSNAATSIHSLPNEIFAPAELDSVITVGEGTALSSSGAAMGAGKPDVQVKDATIRFTDGNSYSGSSPAAAIVAGAMAVWKALKPSLSRQEIFSEIKSWKNTDREIAPSSGKNVDSFVQLKSSELALVDRKIIESLPMSCSFYRNSLGLLRVSCKQSAAKYLKRTELSVGPGEFLMWNPIAGDFKIISASQFAGFRSPWIHWTSDGATQEESSTEYSPARAVPKWRLPTFR